MFLAAACRVAETLAPNDELCCVFAERVLREVYGDAVVDRAPAADWRVWDIAARWSPVSAADRAGIATRVHVPTGPTPATVLEPGRWHLCQGWGATTGHTFLFAQPCDAGTGIVLDSAGAQFRPPPGPQLRLVRWAELTARYTRGVAVAVLGVPR